MDESRKEPILHQLSVAPEHWEAFVKRVEEMFPGIVVRELPIEVQNPSDLDNGVYTYFMAIKSPI